MKLGAAGDLAAVWLWVAAQEGEKERGERRDETCFKRLYTLFHLPSALVRSILLLLLLLLLTLLLKAEEGSLTICLFLVRPSLLSGPFLRDGN